MGKCNLRFSIMCSLFLAGNSGTTLGADSSGEPEAPLVGRKEPFCGAVGAGRFKVSMSANPTSLQAGDPRLLTIRIEAVGPWVKGPERPDLVKTPAYRKCRERIHIENDNERSSPTLAKGVLELLM